MSEEKKYIIKVSMPDKMTDREIEEELFGLFAGSKCNWWEINKDNE